MNGTNATSFDHFRNDVSTGHIVYYIIHMIIAFFTITVNGTVLYILITSERLHSPTNWIFGSHAMADIMLAVLRPYHGLLEIRVQRLALACVTISSLSVATGSISMLHLTLVSLDRYTMITRPLHYHTLITLRRSRTATTIIWVGTIVISLIPVMGVKRPDFTDDSYCSPEIFMSLWYFVLMLVVTFIIPSNILIMAYYKIFKIAYVHNKQIAQETRGSSGVASDLKSGLRSSKLFATLAGFFFVCWMPYFIIRILHVFAGVSATSARWDYVALTVGSLNSLGNPLLYAFRQEDIRKELSKRFKCFLWNTSAEHTPSDVVANTNTRRTRPIFIVETVP